MKRKVPRMTSDEEAEAFLQQDLSGLDFSQFKPVQFEFEAKSAQLNMRVPEALLDAVKQRAKARGIPYTRYIRQLMEEDVAKRTSSAWARRNDRRRPQTVAAHPPWAATYHNYLPTAELTL